MRDLRGAILGPGGQPARASCLSAFPQTWHVTLAPATADQVQGFDDAPAPVDWAFGADGRRETGQIGFTGSSGGRVLVDRGPDGPVFYLMAEHAG